MSSSQSIFVSGVSQSNLLYCIVLELQEREEASSRGIFVSFNFIFFLYNNTSLFSKMPYFHTEELLILTTISRIRTSLTECLEQIFPAVP